MAGPSSAGAAAVPYREIDTVFLDVGNTLITMDLPRVAGELARHGLRCSASELMRAEAAARPAVSARVAAGSSTETVDLFAFYLRQALLHLPTSVDAAALDRVAIDLATRLRPPGGSDRLWNTVIPGIPEALGALAALGLRMVVVSNSDGTVERSLTRLGLRPFFAAVVDSGTLGLEKPDPRIFEAALRLASADPARTLHFGDLYHVDVVGARRANLHAALVDPFGDWAAGSAHASAIDCDRFEHLRDLAACLSAARSTERP
ncbi:MAG: HAD family hydrolase [Planctomycetota bacterium]